MREGWTRPSVLLLKKFAGFGPDTCCELHSSNSASGHEQHRGHEVGGVGSFLACEYDRKIRIDTNEILRSTRLMAAVLARDLSALKPVGTFSSVESSLWPRCLSYPSQSIAHSPVSAASRMPLPIVLPSCASSDLNHCCCLRSIPSRLEAMVNCHTTKLAGYGLTSSSESIVIKVWPLGKLQSPEALNLPREKGMVNARLSAMELNRIEHSNHCCCP